MRLIDADKLLKHVYEDKEDPYTRGWDDAIYAIVGYEPTADTVKVVKCENCKWWQRVDGYGGIYGHCEHFKQLVNKPVLINMDFFCADGEAEEDDETDRCR